MSAAQPCNLPVELLSKIASYLSLKQCVRFERVNSVWRGVMLKQQRQITFINLGDCISTSAINRAERKAGEPSKKKRRVEESLIKWLRSICHKIHRSIEKIEIGPIWRVQSQMFLEELLAKGAPKLTALDLEWYLDDDDSIEGVASLKGLSDLRLVLSGEEEVEDSCLAVLKKVFSSLKSLKHLDLKLEIGAYPDEYEEDRQEDWLSDEFYGTVNVDYVPAIISYIPLCLHTLRIHFDAKFVNQGPIREEFRKLHMVNLKVLQWEDDGYGSYFEIDARNFPSLQELILEGAGKIRNLGTLKHLEKLWLANPYAFNYSDWLEAVTSDDCEFRSSLLELHVEWQRRCGLNLYGTTLLSKVSLLHSLQSLTLCGMPSEDEDRVRGLRCIGVTCLQLTHLKIFNAEIGGSELAVIAKKFLNLTTFELRETDGPYSHSSKQISPNMSLSDSDDDGNNEAMWNWNYYRDGYQPKQYSSEISPSSLQRFVNLLSRDRELKITFERGPRSYEVDELLADYPNIDYF